MNTFFGVDGCKGGWAIAGVNTTGKLTPIKVLPSFAHVHQEVEGSLLTLIDIPIGFRHAGPLGRTCDGEARHFVRGRGASVFPVPVRDGIYADSLQQAKQISSSVSGKKIANQAWGICPKMREVDRAMRLNPALQRAIRETHPEVCFCGLNGGCPLRYYKKTREGAEERIGVLERYVSGVRDTYELAQQCSRGRISRDDALDAIAAAVTAYKCYEQGARTFPSEPEVDPFGLRMEIVYWCP